IDAEGNYTQAYFLQGALDKGRPYRQEVYDKSGHLFARTLNTWTARELYPGVSFIYLAQTKSFAYDGNSAEGGSNFKHSQTTFTYDDYGNPTQVTTAVNSPDNPAGFSDTKTQITEYNYNTDDWLLTPAKHTYLLDAQGTKLSEKWFYYDQHNNLDAPPEKGLLTKEEVLIANPIRQKSSKAAALYRYDTYGNLTKSVDPLRRATFTEYDSLTQTYPVKTTNALGHSVESSYYGINESLADTIDGSGLPGQVKYTQDPNKQRTYSLYDQFGRLLEVIGPQDSPQYPAALYEYDLSATPIRVIKKVKPDYDANLDDYYRSYSFFDGLGREIYTKTPAEAEPQNNQSRQLISGITEYNSKGQIIKKYLPYFVEESADYLSPNFSTPHSHFTYDALGRVIQTTNPDSSYSSTVYSAWSVSSIDPNGHKTAKFFDGWGRIIKVLEFEGSDGRSKDYPYQDYGFYAATTYQYDAQGNLTQLTDNQNNTTRICYDSLGRKLQMDDPDMGVWHYEYDPVGNLIQQTDNKGQVLLFQYDGLNRLTLKGALLPKAGADKGREEEDEKSNGLDFTTLASYLYDQPNKPNSLGRLSKVIDQSGSTEFFYDQLGQEIKSVKVIGTVPATSGAGLAQGTVPSGAYTVERSYDSLDRLTYLKYPDGSIVKYTYNPQGIERIEGLPLQASPQEEAVPAEGTAPQSVGTVPGQAVSGVDQGTVPYAPDSFTKLFWHADTTAGLTGHGGARIDTAQKKFGLGSAFFDGKDDYFTIPDSDDWNFGAGDFT
ncbi:MAG: RHS repeat protein, partial [Candidatus Kerfeldbacteria bacterium]|nr:RHS repeat protein [Candidatus Kerfeldbacteria bacterium]